MNGAAVLLIHLGSGPHCYSQSLTMTLRKKDMGETYRELDITSHDHSLTFVGGLSIRSTGGRSTTSFGGWSGLVTGTSG
jgi:hypothetical protein